MVAMNMPTKTTAEKIFEWYHLNKQTPHRAHLGASIIGHRCLRYPWMAFRWTLQKKFDGRMLRLFEYGNEAEVRMARNLRDIGVTLHTTQPGTNKQWSVSAFGGHFGGSMDGIGEGFPEGPQKMAVWECKTMNAKSFADLVKDKLKKAKPQHYAQVMIYMGLTKLTRAMYTAENKDTDEVETVWVHFDKEMFDTLMARAFTIISSFVPPEKISNDSSFWICRQCDFQAICHRGKIPEVNCRTCAMAKPMNYTADVESENKPEGGDWHCMRWNAPIPLAAQRVGCDAHRIIPIFMEKHNKFVGIVAGSGNFKYKDLTTEVEWEQGEGLTALSSKEIESMDLSLMASVVATTKAGLVAQGITSKVAGGSGGPELEAMKADLMAVAERWDEE